MRGHSKRENREILLVSILHGGMFACIVERSDNVSDGTADMNANRKSDGPVIPAKRTNKTGTPESENLCMRKHSKRENREILLVSVGHGGEYTEQRNGQQTFPTVMLT